MIKSRSMRFRTKLLAFTFSPVSGSVSCKAYHSSIADLSYVFPFSLITGSVMRSQVSGQLNSSGTSTSSRPSAPVLVPAVDRKSFNPFLNSSKVMFPEPSASSFLKSFVASSSPSSSAFFIFSSFSLSTSLISSSLTCVTTSLLAGFPPSTSSFLPDDTVLGGMGFDFFDGFLKSPPSSTSTGKSLPSSSSLGFAILRIR
mmetsp:Transcript_1720/g.3987  ORF Transcript_1720/g.3987 Transcript_1720/m.3987 type:complete len:200 (-) Transcript_1720:152-751(-)